MNPDLTKSKPINETSRRLFARARRVIPWGTQTNAKRPIEDHLPQMPAYIKRGNGCRLWDVDDNEYIDFRAALGPIILGYADPDVDQAVKQQIDQGVLYSMAAPQELDLAERICRLVPCAEMVRFLKSGGDACSAAVKLARACTGREEIISIGYHGWHDWSIAGLPERRTGVPTCLIRLVHPCPYGDAAAIQALMQERGDKVAAVVVSPYDWESDGAGQYLQHLRQLCDQNQALLIFDEVVTGFRLAMGGAGEYFGVDPDVAVFGKAVANGYPLALIAGRRKFMQVMEEIFVTVTHGGELASIAAARATLAKLQRCNVHEHVWRLGQRLAKGITDIFAELDLPVEIKGLPPAHTVLPPETIDTHARRRPFRVPFIKAVYAKGVFWNDPLFIMYAHTQEDIDKALAFIREAARDAKQA